MFLTLKEMELLCVFHSGTVSATLDLLRKTEDESPERMSIVESVIEKLSKLKDGDTISLAFDPEN